MKRFSVDHVEKAARNFAASTIARSWNLFGAEVQKALVDSFVMQEIQWAHVADSEQRLTPTEIIEFRDAVVGWLALGVVPAGTRGMKVAFKVEL